MPSIGMVQSTGSGKSCTVARILHEAVGVQRAKNLHCDDQKNAHVVIFDIHSEYAAAFELEEEQRFTLNRLGVDKLALPYWLMNSEELESIFIESNEANSHNQVSQFRNAVVQNKKRHNPGLPDDSGGIADALPSLSQGQCVVVGDATILPSVVSLDMPEPEPHSRSVAFHDEWSESWRDIKFSDVIARWKGDLSSG